MAIYINEREDVQEKLMFLNLVDFDKTVDVQLGYMKFTIRAYIADCFNEDGDVDVCRRFTLSGFRNLETDDIFEIFWILEDKAEEWEERRTSHKASGETEKTSQLSLFDEIDADYDFDDELIDEIAQSEADIAKEQIEGILKEAEIFGIKGQYSEYETYKSRIYGTFADYKLKEQAIHSLAKILKI